MTTPSYVWIADGHDVRLAEWESVAGRFDLVGTKSNRDAVGARLRLRTGEHWQTRVVNAGSGYVSSSSKRQHFGLGDAVHIDELEIQWPSGERTLLRDLEGDRAYQIIEGQSLASGVH